MFVCLRKMCYCDVGSVQAFVLLFLMQQALKELMSHGLLGDIIFKCSLLMD